VRPGPANLPDSKMGLGLLGIFSGISEKLGGGEDLALEMSISYSVVKAGSSVNGGVQDHLKYRLWQANPGEKGQVACVIQGICGENLGRGK